MGFDEDIFSIGNKQHELASVINQQIGLLR